MSYWTYTDLFEEPGPPPTPFHGGFGLLNREGIRKPAYFRIQVSSCGPGQRDSGPGRASLRRGGERTAFQP